MNWTGGHLSRHSNSKGSLRARQKQHFAKVQASLRSGIKKLSPLKFSCLGNSTGAVANTLDPRSGSTLSRDRCGSQPVQPPQSNSSDTPAPLFDESYHGSPSHKHQSKDLKNHELVIEERMHSIPDDDLYSATPLSRRRKRKRESSAGQSKQDTIQDPEEESELERRRKLLGRGDWVGVNVQRPLQLAFASPVNGDLVGRRRKVTDGHRAQYSHNMQSLVTYPNPWENRINSPRNLGGRGHGMTHLGRSDVRISIGGRVVPPGLGSSSVPSKGREASVRSSIFEQSQASSSDVMLLDNEVVVETDNVERSPTLAADACGGRHTLDWRDEYNSRGPKRTGVKQFQPIFSSSTTSLRHPRPRSSRTSLLLRSDSPEIAESMVAQVGKVKAVVPSSQGLDNELWESWVGRVLKAETQLLSSGRDTASSKQMSISPGPSHAPISRHAQRRMPSEYSNESSSRGLRLSMQGDAELSQRSVPQQHFSTSSEGQLEGESLSSEINLDSTERLSIYHPYPSADIHGGPRANYVVKETDQPVPATEELDSDSAWKKFVFGSIDDGVEADETHGKKPPDLPIRSRPSAPPTIFATPYTRTSVYSTSSTRSPLSDLPSCRYQN